MMAGVFYRETGNNYGSLLELPRIVREAWFAVNVYIAGGRWVQIFCKRLVFSWHFGKRKMGPIIHDCVDGRE
jgi:hypothetical protein